MIPLDPDVIRELAEAQIGHLALILLIVTALCVTALAFLLAPILRRANDERRRGNEISAGLVNAMTRLAQSHDQQRQAVDHLAQSSTAEFNRLHEHLRDMEARLPSAVSERLAPDLNRFVGELDRFLKAVSDAVETAARTGEPRRLRKSVVRRFWESFVG